MIKKLALCFMGICIIPMIIGCAGPMMGLIYSDVTVGNQLTAGTMGKTGQACASNILGVYSSGDASIAAAARNGGISSVATVDSQATNILGLYSSLCTIVSGQ